MTGKAALVLSVFTLLLITAPSFAFVEDLCIHGSGQSNLFQQALAWACPYGTDYANTPENCTKAMVSVVFNGAPPPGCFSTINFFSGTPTLSILLFEMRFDGLFLFHGECLSYYGSNTRIVIDVRC